MKLWSLRAKLIVLILLAILPVIALEINAAREAALRADDDIFAEARRLAHLVAANQRRIFETSQQLLMTLTQVESLQPYREHEGCRTLLRRLLLLNPIFANIGAADAEGNVFCSALNLPGPVNVSHRPYFKRAQAIDALVSDEFDAGMEIARKPALVLAYRLSGSNEEFLGAVFLAIDLEAASNFSADVMLPPGGTLAVITDHGRYLLRHPDPAKWVGREAGVLAGGPDSKDERRIDVTEEGVERLYFVERLWLTPLRYADVAVGIDRKRAYQPFQAALQRQLLIMATIAATALAMAWVLGSSFIVRPARHLVSVARAISRGDLKVRSALPLETGEFGEIGGAMNQMTDALEHRIEELNGVQQELREAHDELELRVERRTQELKLARERLVDAIENIDAGFVMFGPDERLVVCNQTYRDMFSNCTVIRPGVTFEEILRDFVRTGGTVEGVRDYDQWIEARIATLRRANGEVVEQKINGRWLSATDHRMRDGGVVSLRTDVTERTEAHAALERAAKELRRSNEELERFAYVASHDLQEPLRMVASYTQLLSRRYKDKLDEPAQEFIGFAVNGAQRMQAFIQDLLRYSRVGTHGRPFERLSLAEIVGRVLENLRYAIEEKNAEITVGDLPTVEGDRLQLTQLFQNLISNALKFSADRPLKIAVRAEWKEDAWEITVSDNGIGLDPEDTERIFVIFQRLHTRQEYEGTGIGLAICKKIVERHGGRIWVESRKGEGASFHFTLPDRTEEAEPAP